MRWARRPFAVVAILITSATLGACGIDRTTAERHPKTPRASSTGKHAGWPALKLGRVPPTLKPRDVYAADRPMALSKRARHARSLIYVPNSLSSTVDVIDPHTFRVVEHFATGALPQHVTPSWDMRTLWVDNDLGNSLTPIDPVTGRPGKRVSVRDPYNLYFTPNGRRAIVVAEAHQALDFRNPTTMRLRHSLSTPQCAGIDHMDFSADGYTALASCEFAGRLIVVDLHRERIVKTIGLPSGAKPQDVKLSPDGRRFYVADMMSNGVWVIDARTMKKLRLIPTGRGAHGLYVSRNSRVLYVTNRDSGSISLLSLKTGHVFRTWHLPPPSSPDMGNLSPSGRVLWLSGRYNSSVYALSTRTGRLLHTVSVGRGPHGLCVWPQPGRYSTGHTGVMR